MDGDFQAGPGTTSRRTDCEKIVTLNDSGNGAGELRPLRTIGHDMNGPLAAITFGLELIRDAADFGPEDLATLHDMSLSGEKLRLLVLEMRGHYPRPTDS